jgi:hypothetical protein
MKEKYIVFKKVLAHELILVEAESPTNAVEEVMEGKGTVAKNVLEWYEDCDPNTWHSEPINATDEELQALRRSARRLPNVFTGSDSPLGDDEC